MRTDKTLLIALMGLVMLFSRCHGAKEVPHTFPSAQEAADIRGDFREQFDRGAVLYAENCGGCHNMKVGNKLVIPDFSLPQLLDYEMRMQYPSHGDRLTEARVTKEELDDIQVFLKYRKPSGHPVAPPPMPQPPPKMN